MKFCTKCTTFHEPPTGRRCPRTVKMACVGGGFTDRNDEAYLKFLEDKFKENEKQAAGGDSAMQRVLDRLDRLESARGPGGRHYPPDNPSPADLTQLSDSIHQLSLSVHPEPAKTGTELRPEYHVQVIAKGGQIKNMSAANLRSEELMYGMMCAYDHLLASGGDAGPYFKHMLFVSRHLMERNFTVSACSRYDKYVVDTVLAGKGKFSDPDPVAIGLFLHGGAVARNDQVRQQPGIMTRSPYQNRFSQLRECNRENTPSFMPENWPQEICFMFNSKTCFGRCNKQHVCGYCRLKHRLADCKFAVGQVNQDQSRM